MKKIVYIYLSIIILISCNSKKDSFNTIEYKENSDIGSLRNVRIFDSNDKFLTKPLFNSSPNEKGILVDTFSIKKSGIHILDLVTLNTNLYIKKGDILKINYSSNSSNPDISFEGDNKEINQFIFENKKISNNLYNNFDEIQLESVNEKDILKNIFKNKEECEKKFNENKSKIKDSIIQFEMKENECIYVNLCLLYKYKLNKFSKDYKNTPQIDLYLKKFNDNDIELFNSSSLYRTVLYEFHKSRFNEVTKRKDLNEFLSFLKKNKIHKEIQDYLLSIYATNYFITDYTLSKKRKETYEYLITILKDQECRNYIYKSYIKYTNQN